eukprot:TRINITY_DN11523_c0_g1_i2.p1 TRINITY_DN11523_c0_g1~~TRINITY_DN11523_c0_g1_i2.p1  ORF type:complete len:106 (+),score=20.73 TRINITY_DN11523_c0_g1_i2:80-397(+)
MLSVLRAEIQASNSSPWRLRGLLSSTKLTNLLLPATQPPSSPSDGFPLAFGLQLNLPLPLLVKGLSSLQANVNKVLNLLNILHFSDGDGLPPISLSVQCSWSSPF